MGKLQKIKAFYYIMWGKCTKKAQKRAYSGRTTVCRFTEIENNSCKNDHPGNGG